MHNALLGLGLAALLGTAPPPDDEDDTQANLAETDFAYWAETLGLPIQRSACFVEPDTETATCYGTLGNTLDAFQAPANDDGSWSDFTPLFLPLAASQVPTTTGAAPTTSTMTIETAPAEPATTFGDGTWLVGVDIAPGSYRAPGGGDCHWARFADLNGEDIIITNEFSTTNSQVLVEIMAGDVAFATNGCGTWATIPSST